MDIAYERKETDVLEEMIECSDEEDVREKGVELLQELARGR